jgi:hypothetical protein
VDIISIKNEIDSKIKILEQARGLIKQRGIDKANAITDYEKNLAMVTVGLKNGRTYKIGDEEVINPPTTYLKDISKGICWEEKLKMEVAESNYKSLIVNIDCIMAELNALQSLWKHLDNR